MFVVKHRKIFYTITILLAVLSLFFVFYSGLNLSIDFTGGSVLEVRYETTSPDEAQVKETAETVIGKEVVVKTLENNGFSLTAPFLAGDKHDELLKALAFDNKYGALKEEQLSSVGPVVGQELKRKSLVAISLISLAIIIFIAFAFRKISKPVSSWIYGIIAVIALLHDILIPVGIFAFLGATIGIQMDILFITAILVILGYSVNDTIVVFDRIRENLDQNNKTGRRENFEDTVGRSLNQVYGRSINTSLATLLALLSLFFLGGETTKYFSLVLITGVIAGTYSSIFLASPLLVTIEKRFISKTAR